MFSEIFINIHKTFSSYHQAQFLILSVIKTNFGSFERKSKHPSFFASYIFFYKQGNLNEKKNKSIVKLTLAKFIVILTHDCLKSLYIYDNLLKIAQITKNCNFL